MSNWNQPPGAPPGGFGGPPPGGYGPPPGGYGPPPGGYGAPPPGGYGAPPPGGYGQPAPYGAQPPNVIMDPVAYPTRGSMGLGFCAGFFGGCIGYILVLAIAKGPETKRGAGIGFAAQIVVGALLRLINH